MTPCNPKYISVPKSFLTHAELACTSHAAMKPPRVNKLLYSSMTVVFGPVLES